MILQASYFSGFCRISGFHIMNFTWFQALIFKFSVFMQLKKGYFRLWKRAFQAWKSIVSMRPVASFTTIHPDGTYTVQLGWIKQKIQKSLRCLTIFQRCLHEPTTIHDGAITVLLLAPQHNHRAVILYSWWIGMNPGWIVRFIDHLDTTNSCWLECLNTNETN